MSAIGSSFFSAFTLQLSGHVASSLCLCLSVRLYVPVCLQGCHACSTRWTWAGLGCSQKSPHQSQFLSRLCKKALYSTDPDPGVAAQTAVSKIFWSQIADLTPITLKRIPRLSEPGPLGMRAEH